MRPLFSLLILAALVLAQGTSLASSICRHGSLQAHMAARQSHDARAVAVAFAEEAAADTASKKGSASNADTGPLLTVLPPPSAPAAILFAGERLLPQATDRPALAGISPRPPLPPPDA